MSIIGLLGFVAFAIIVGAKIVDNWWQKERARLLDESKPAGVIHPTKKVPSNVRRFPTGEPLTDQDLDELEGMFGEAGSSPRDYDSGGGA